MKFLKIFEKKSNKSQLGGNLGKTNIDEDLLRFLYTDLKMRSFLDIGCGPGGMVFNASYIGFKARGIEGDPNSIPKDCPLITQIDYRKTSSGLKNKFDIGYSCEFLEHIPAKYMKNYMEDFNLCKSIIITAAPPGWGGIGHVNEQSEDYWIKTFSENNFQIDKKMTQKIREISCIKFAGKTRASKKQFIKNRGLFFNKI